MKLKKFFLKFSTLEHNAPVGTISVLQGIIINTVLCVKIGHRGPHYLHLNEKIRILGASSVRSIKASKINGLFSNAHLKVNIIVSLLLILHAWQNRSADQSCLC